jgi:hypothetical protein
MVYNEVTYRKGTTLHAMINIEMVTCVSWGGERDQERVKYEDFMNEQN